MNFKKRARNFWACVSITFNQAIHFGNAPYPLSLSETCYLRSRLLRYRVGMTIIDFLFSLAGETEHCERSFIKGKKERARYV